MPKKKRKSPNLLFRSVFRLGIALVLIIVLADIFYVKPHIFYPGFEITIPQGYSIHGIDVSKYQGIINWEEVTQMKVKDVKIGFVFIKATEGRTLVDGQFRNNWTGAAKVHVPRGAYHFFVPGRDPEKQAKNFMGIVALEQGNLPPVLDVEVAGRLSVEQMRGAVQQWLDIVEEHYGVIPIIYTNVSFYDTYFSEGFEKYPVWIAHYLEPDGPRFAREWAFWQHSETGRVNGIRHPVDFNVFHGDSMDFKEMLIGERVSIPVLRTNFKTDKFVSIR